MGDGRQAGMGFWEGSELLPVLFHFLVVYKVCSFLG